MTAPFPLVEKAVKEAVETYGPADGNTGRALAYDGTQPLYVWVGLIPGGGRTDEINGQWSVDVDCFGTSYSTTMGHALEIEALLVGKNHVTDTMRLDDVTQNQAPHEVFWDEETVYRISATYVFTARRSA